MIGAKNFIGSLIDQWLQKWSNCKILSWDSLKPQKETFQERIFKSIQWFLFWMILTLWPKSCPIIDANLDRAFVESTINFCCSKFPAPFPLCPPLRPPWFSTDKNDKFSSENTITTLQSVMHGKLNQQRFWPCHESMLKTIPSIPNVC